MTTPQHYAPGQPGILDTLGYTRRVVDAILRNNPLTDATVSEGLVKWLGNYVTAGSTDRINFLWIGEFFPGDPNLGGIAQRGVSMVRDDSRGGVSAFAMYDPLPTAGGGLRQVLVMTSGDGHQLMRESRQGGVHWPQENVALCPLGDTVQWPGVQGGTFGTVWEGIANVLGNEIHYRLWAISEGGAAGEVRVRVEDFGGSGGLVSTTHVVAAGGNQVFETSFDVSSLRGRALPLHVEARRTNAVGTLRVAAVSVRCFTSAAN